MVGEKIPEGYKQTEVGVVPEEWGVLNLATSSTLKARIGWQGLTTNEYLDSGEYILITGTDFHKGLIDWQHCHFVSKERYDQDHNIQILNGDILITKDGTIGKVAYVESIPGPGTLNSGVFVIRPKDNSYYSKYVNFIFKSNYFNQFLNRLKAGSTIAHLYQKDFVGFNFPLPPLPEQKAIAEVLSDTDALIESMEALIAKKRAVKQGSMQELLTGRRRLPGFGGSGRYRQTEVGVVPEEWEVKTLGALADIFRGASPRPIDDPQWFAYNGKVGWLRISDITKANKYLKTTTQKLSDNGIKQSRFIPSGNLVMSICATVGRPVLTQTEVCIHDGFVVFDKLSEDKEFLFYILQQLESEWVKSGQTGSQMNLNTDLIKNKLIPLPPLPEQKAIAEVLSDMDAEIETLEQKREKYKKIKQGMMDQLLTGKVRLV